MHMFILIERKGRGATTAITTRVAKQKQQYSNNSIHNHNNSNGSGLSLIRDGFCLAGKIRSDQPYFSSRPELDPDPGNVISHEHLVDSVYFSALDPDTKTES